MNSCSLASSLRKRDMNCERDCTVLPLSTAHFFVFIIGVSPTAFNSTSIFFFSSFVVESSDGGCVSSFCVSVGDSAVSDIFGSPLRVTLWFTTTSTFAQQRRLLAQKKRQSLQLAILLVNNRSQEGSACQRKAEAEVELRGLLSFVLGDVTWEIIL